jgi:hypothetical protein
MSSKKSRPKPPKRGPDRKIQPGPTPTVGADFLPLAEGSAQDTSSITGQTKKDLSIKQGARESDAYQQFGRLRSTSPFAATMLARRADRREGYVQQRAVEDAARRLR